MSQPKRILIIGGRKKVLKTAKALGLQVLYIQKKDKFDAAHLAFADQTFLLDYEQPEVLLPIVRAIYEVFPFGYTFSMDEWALIPVARVTDLFGLPGNSLETVTLLRDKWAMRQHLNKLGFSPVAAQIGRTREDIAAFAREYGLPMIAKPSDGAGSFGIFTIQKLADIDSAWAQIQQLGLASFLMEEYLEGPEISAESVSFGGRHVVLATTNKLLLPNYVEIGHSIPAEISEDMRASVNATVVEFLDAVGMREGTAHTELKLTPKGIRIVESHNRVGGSKINTMVQLVYGVDMTWYSLAWPFGLTEAITQAPPAHAGAAIRYFTPAPGIVREISGVAAAQDIEGVVEIEMPISVGSQVPPLRHSPDRQAYVVASGPNARAAIARCEQALQKVRIVTEAATEERHAPCAAD
jgi:biotin carboxylase